MTKKDPYVMPEWMASWGEADPGREYAEAEAKGPAALDRLGRRRLRREERYWAPIRAAEEQARRERELAAIEQARVDHAAYMRDYRASRKAHRQRIQGGTSNDR